MTEFAMDQARSDPYRNFKFRVWWDGRYVAGVSRVSALRRTTEVVEHREGGDPCSTRKAPGRTSYDAVTLERGVTHDSEFEDWASQVSSLGCGPAGEASVKDFRKDVTLEVHDDAGKLVVAYRVFRCWVSEYVALADLDAGANAVAVEQIKLENEGWERDDRVSQPARGKRSGSAAS
jgi:phage tail-like protein